MPSPPAFFSSVICRIGPSGYASKGRTGRLSGPIRLPIGTSARICRRMSTQPEPGRSRGDTQGGDGATSSRSAREQMTQPLRIQRRHGRSPLRTRRMGPRSARALRRTCRPGDPEANHRGDRRARRYRRDEEGRQRRGVGTAQALLRGGAISAVAGAVPRCGRAARRGSGRRSGPGTGRALAGARGEVLVGRPRGADGLSNRLDGSRTLAASDETASRRLQPRGGHGLHRAGGCLFPQEVFQRGGVGQVDRTENRAHGGTGLFRVAGARGPLSRH